MAVAVAAAKREVAEQKSKECNPKPSLSAIKKTARGIDTSLDR
jgi:hypothetical protein